MNIEVVQLPKDLRDHHLVDRAVAVFDVLRATTSMTAALSAGVSGIRIFARLDDARDAAGSFHGPKILCGESACLPPEGFDLGNSPGAFERSKHAGRTMFMCTTNGTRALVATASASRVFAGAIVNASAVAKVLGAAGRDVTLLCAGTDGEVAAEDLIGAGAVIAAMGGANLVGEPANVAERLFAGNRDNLHAALADAAGGRNVIRAGLPEDVAFAAVLDRFDVVGELKASPLRIEATSSRR